MHVRGVTENDSKSNSSGLESKPTFRMSLSCLTTPLSYISMIRLMSEAKTEKSSVSISSVPRSLSRTKTELTYSFDILDEMDWI